MRPTRSRPSARKARGRPTARAARPRWVPEEDAVGHQAQPRERRAASTRRGRPPAWSPNTAGATSSVCRTAPSAMAASVLAIGCCVGERLGDAEEAARSQQRRERDERRPGAHPAQARALDDDPHEAGATIAARDGDAGHRERHPERQPRGIARAGWWPAIRDDEATPPRPGPRRRTGPRAASGPSRRASAARRSPTRAARDRRTPPRTASTRPGCPRRRVLGVELQEQVVAPPVVGEHPDDAGEDGQHGQRQPVRGHDPQRAPAQIAAGRGHRSARRPRGDVGPVEQEARDHEEEAAPWLPSRRRRRPAPAG